MKGIQSVNKKINFSPFVVIVFFLLFATLVAYLFRNQLTKITSPSHLAEIKLNELTPEVRNLVLSSQRYLNVIELFEKNSQTSSLSTKQKGVMSLLVSGVLNNINKAVKLDPENAHLWLYRCRVYKLFINLTDEYSKNAIDSCERSIKLSPENRVTYDELGGIYLYQKDYKKAVQFYEDVVKKFPKDKNAYYNLGFAYKGSGLMDKARLSFQKAMGLVDKDEEKNLIQKQIDSLK